MEVYVAGTRSYAGEVVDFAAEIGYTVVGLLEPSDRSNVGTVIHALEVDWLEEPRLGVRAAIVGTGDVRRRPILERLEAAGFETVTVVHPHAHISRTSTVGSGSIVGPGVVVGAHCVLGENVLLNRGALVGHHTSIGSFATVGPGGNIAGNVKVGADVFIGMGAAVRDHLEVGEGAVVAMGAVVVADVPPWIEVRGVPAIPHGAVERTFHHGGQE